VKEYLNAVKGAIGFLSILPIGENPEEFESFRRRIYLMPLVGLILGLICGIICYLLSFLLLQFLTPLAFVSVEGINHLDGLADVGDAIFAPETRRFNALKDINTGTGGTIFLLIWIISISLTSIKMSSDWIFFTSLISELSAKTCMMLMLSTTKPLWTGMGSYMMEFAKFDNSAKSAIFAGGFAFFVQLVFKYPALILFTFSLLLFLILRFYFMRVFGGVNGDMFGATNCIVLAFNFILAWCLKCWLF